MRIALSILSTLSTLGTRSTLSTLGTRSTRGALRAAALSVLIAATAAAADTTGPAPVDGPLAPTLAGMGDHEHPISSRIPEAQRFFNQGMALAFGFNHAEAERAFREAARQDPDCAICWWGAAWTLGPNYNTPMAPEAVPPAWEALERALALVERASENERAYIHALARRYRPEVVEDRKPLDRAFADAMREVTRAFPDDLDALSIFAQSLMELIPWDLYTPEGEPKPETAEALAALEQTLTRDPYHPLALHLYIHAVEKVHPKRAEPVADRLRGLVPGAGHLVHMPSHIYIRVGRYDDALAVNFDADAADEAYVAQCHAQGIYPLAYHSHNVHFIAAAAGFSGRSQVAIQAARKLAQRHEDQHDLMASADWATLQYYYAMPLYALLRFGAWDEILAEPEPAADLPYTRATWHYARGTAFTRRGDLAAAAAELAALSSLAADPAMDDFMIWGLNSFRQIFTLGREVLSGELAAARGDFDTAVAHLEEAVYLEDSLVYDEPPDWQIPVRQNLGAVLLAAGRPDDAEDIYREDLEIYPDNGWSLYGLLEALRAQGKDVTEAEKRFREVWKEADVRLAASRF